MSTNTRERTEDSLRVLESPEYKRAVNDLKELIQSARLSGLRTKYEIGRRILGLKKELRDAKLIVNDEGWTGVLTELSKKLQKETGYSRSQLGHCHKFAETFSSFDAFLDKEFRVGEVANKLETPLRGRDAKWKQVVGWLYGDRRIKETRSLAATISKEAYAQLEQDGVVAYGSAPLVKTLLSEYQNDPSLRAKVQDEILRFPEEETRKEMEQWANRLLTRNGREQGLSGEEIKDYRQDPDKFLADVVPDWAQSDTIDRRDLQLPAIRIRPRLPIPERPREGDAITRSKAERYLGSLGFEPDKGYPDRFSLLAKDGKVFSVIVSDGEISLWILHIKDLNLLGRLLNFSLHQ